MNERVRKARDLIGVMYNYAGMYSGVRESGKMHCAEFTAAVYDGKVPANVYRQLEMLTTHPGKGQPGDIIVYGVSPEWGLPHVGILTEKGTVVHASAEYGQVVETNGSDMPDLFIGYVHPNIED
jgi:hypothetical protein